MGVNWPPLRTQWRQRFCILCSGMLWQPSMVVTFVDAQVHDQRWRWNWQPRLTQEMQSARLGGAFTWWQCAAAE